MRDINIEEQKEIIRRAQLKILIASIDKLEPGQGVFIGDDEVKNIRSVYLAMYKKGKKFSQTKQATGHTLTRIA